MDYRRAYVDGGCYFFTVALANREGDLLVQHIETLRAAFKYVKGRHPFKIDAMVVYRIICIAFGRYRKVIVIMRSDGR